MIDSEGVEELAEIAWWVWPDAWQIEKLSNRVEVKYITGPESHNLEVFPFAPHTDRNHLAKAWAVVKTRWLDPQYLDYLLHVVLDADSGIHMCSTFDYMNAEPEQHTQALLQLTRAYEPDTHCTRKQPGQTT